MEHDGVEVLEDSRIEDARLPQGRPLFDAGIGDDTFGKSFGKSVMVVRGDADRVACPSPMERFATVAHLGYGPHIDHFGLLVFGLGKNSLCHILRGRDIGAQCRFRTIVRLRRDHTAYMQDDVCAGDTFEHILIVREVAPDDVELRV